MKLFEVMFLLISVVISSGVGSFVAQELLKHKLNKQLFRFTKLYTDKLDVIRIFYQKLVFVEKALGIFMIQIEPSNVIEKAKFNEETLKVIDDFIEYFELNELIFDDEIVNIVQVIIEKVKESKKAQNSASFFEDSRGTNAWRKSTEAKQYLFEKFVLDELPKLKTKLKSDFQKRYSLLSK